MAVDEFDISEEERERRRDEADLICRLILAGAGSGRLTQADIDRVLASGPDADGGRLYS